MTRALLSPLFWVMALLPLGWITLFKAGGFSVTLAYVPALALIAILPLRPVQLRGLGPVLSGFGFWLLPYAIYLPLLYIALAGSEAQGMPFRQVFFVTAAVACAVALSVHRDAAALCRAGGAGALILVVIVIEVLAWRVGLSWLDAITRFVTSGDLNFVIYGFFRSVFNALNPDDAESVAASVKNGVAVAVFTSLVLFRAGFSGAARDRTGSIVTLLVFGLLVMLNTRSVLLMAIAAMPLVSVMSAVRRGGVTVAGSLGLMGACLIGLVTLSYVLTSDSVVLSTLFDRFSFDDNSTGARTEQMRWAMARIDTAIWSGSGYAEVGGHPVHNLFVAAWMHAGLPAFLLVVTFYIGLVVTWVRFGLQIVLRPATWALRLRPEWIAVLPLVPMFRVWLSGDAGHMNYIEWVAVGLFMGALAANRAAQPQPRLAPQQWDRPASRQVTPC